ncbi:MAG: hypothetical protein KAQ65_04555 [Candidatus Thorarchaeota archaeon]|nr:hypothetical protein [Candidatus Thorarchaeota archaeon]
MGADDYYEVYRCGNCDDGYIGKTNDSTPGNRFSAEYLCKYCGVKSKKGVFVARESGNDMMPPKYHRHMKIVTNDDEGKEWSDVWWN